MNKLKVFVGLDGHWVLLEKFPNDMEHAGLHEMLDDLVLSHIEVVESPGLYLMSFYVEPSSYFDPQLDDSTLEIDKLEEIDTVQISKQKHELLGALKYRASMAHGFLLEVSKIENPFIKRWVDRVRTTLNELDLMEEI